MGPQQTGTTTGKRTGTGEEHGKQRKHTSLRKDNDVKGKMQPIPPLLLPFPEEKAKPQLFPPLSSLFHLPSRILLPVLSTLPYLI
uniref:Uncharacterized protein n=1 Tax=Setaria digitata TaxID=48799 RepID=A0A915PDW9_9BILA